MPVLKQGEQHATNVEEKKHPEENSASSTIPPVTHFSAPPSHPKPIIVKREEKQHELISNDISGPTKETDIPLQAALIDQLTQEIRALVHEAETMGPADRTNPSKKKNGSKIVTKKRARSKQSKSPSRVNKPSPNNADNKVEATVEPTAAPSKKTSRPKVKKSEEGENTIKSKTKIVLPPRFGPGTGDEESKVTPETGKNKPTTQKHGNSTSDHSSSGKQPEKFKPQNAQASTSKPKEKMKQPDAKISEKSKVQDSTKGIEKPKTPEKPQISENKTLRTSETKTSKKSKTPDSKPRSKVSVLKPDTPKSSTTAKTLTPINVITKSTAKSIIRKASVKSRPATAPTESTCIREPVKILPTDFTPDKAYWVKKAIEKLGNEWVGTGTVPPYMLNTLEFQTAIGSLYDLAIKKKKSKISNLIKDAASMAQKKVSDSIVESNMSLQSATNETSTQQEQTQTTSIIDDENRTEKGENKSEEESASSSNTNVTTVNTVTVSSPSTVSQQVQRHMSTVLFKLMMDRNQSNKFFKSPTMKKEKSDTNMTLQNNKNNNNNNELLLRPATVGYTPVANSSSSRPSSAGNSVPSSTNTTYKGVLKKPSSAKRPNSSQSKKNVAFSVSTSPSRSPEKKKMKKKVKSKASIGSSEVKMDFSGTDEHIDESMDSHTAEVLNLTTSEMLHYTYVYDGKIFVSTPKVSKTFVNTFAPISISRRRIDPTVKNYYRRSCNMVGFNDDEIMIRVSQNKILVEGRRPFRDHLNARYTRETVLLPEDRILSLDRLLVLRTRRGVLIFEEH